MRYRKRQLPMNYSWVGKGTVEKLTMIMNEMVFSPASQKRLELK